MLVRGKSGGLSGIQTQFRASSSPSISINPRGLSNYNCRTNDPAPSLKWPANTLVLQVTACSQGVVFPSGTALRRAAAICLQGTRGTCTPPSKMALGFPAVMALYHSSLAQCILAIRFGLRWGISLPPETCGLSRAPTRGGPGLPARLLPATRPQRWLPDSPCGHRSARF